MPGWWITAIVFFVLAALLAAASFFWVPDQRFYVRGAAVGTALLALVFAVFSSVNIVSTRNVGIVTSFGRPVSERGAGLAITWPWQQVHEMDAAIQLQSFEGSGFDQPGTAIKVRLGNNSSAYVESNLNWRIKENAAGRMFQDFRTFENIRQNLVDKQLQVALSKHFASFNPQQQTQGADLPGIATLVKADLQAAVGTEIEILDVRIPGIFYDKGTQDRIDQFNQRAQETKNAEQQVKTAEQERMASEQRANQPPPNLQVAIFNCVQSASDDHRDAAGCWGQIGGQPLIQLPKP